MNARILLAVAALAAAPALLAAPPPGARPDRLVDLRTDEGVRLVGGSWRIHDARLTDVELPGPGPDGRATGPANRTLDVEPKAGALDFDDSTWEVLAPTALESRRSAGRVAFEWYRIDVTIPESIGGMDPSGSTVVFEIVVDDYAEVWVDGKLPRVLGQSGGSLIAGFNAPNRVVLGRDVHPGERFQIAVFGINGPISDPPANFVWVRSATLEFFRGGIPLPEVPVQVVRRDPGLDAIVPETLRLEKIADGFEFLEGPIWVPEGYLLFSDPNANRIYRWAPDEGITIFRTKSGYSGADVGRYHQPGSNGLTLDPEGRLTIAEHGNRRVTRLEKNGAITVLADRHEGRRLNSPNDLVYRSDGVLYFTDPPFGLPEVFDDPGKETPYSGIYSVRGNRLHLEARELTGPNGLAFSPDERFLYVTNWDVDRKVVTRYDVKPDGGLAGGEVFFDMTGAPGEEALDGIKVDRAGDLFVSGPGGIWVLSADGRHLGTIQTPELPANFTFGDADGRTLYLAARTGLYRMRLLIPGIGPGL